MAFERTQLHLGPGAPASLRPSADLMSKLLKQRHSVEPNDLRSLESAWTGSLAHEVVQRRLTTVTAYTLLCGPLIQFLWVGWMPVIQLSSGSLGLLFLLLGRLRSLRSGVRSGLLIGSLTLQSTIFLLYSGYSPVFTASYSLLVIVTGLLAGRVTMAAVMVALPISFVVLGRGVETGWMRFAEVGRDPNQLSNWARVTVLYSASFVSIWVVISGVAQSLTDMHEWLRQRQHEVDLSRKTMMVLRQARAEEETRLRGVQRSESIERICRGLARHFRDATTYIRDLIEALPSSAPLSERVAVSREIQSALEPTLEIIDDLMVLSRLNSPDRSEGSSLEHVVVTTCRSMGVAEADTSTILQTHLAPELENFGTQRVVQQAVLNLVLNAIEGTSSGIIRVATAYSDAVDGRHTHAQIIVEDTGEGIPARLLARVAEPFHSTRAGQTGLGLAIVQSIAAQHEGWLEVQSRRGVGTRAVLALELREPIRAGSVSANAVVPLEGMLHGAGTLACTKPALSLPPLDFPSRVPPADLSSWRLSFARRLARFIAILVVLTLSVQVAVAPPLPYSVYLTSCSYSVAAAWVGWSRKVSPAVTYSVILFGALGAALTVVLSTSFDNPVGMAALTMALSWGILLKRTRSTIAMILISCVAFVVTGWVREVHLPVSVENLNPNNAVSWFRIAPQLFAAMFFAGSTVVGVLGKLREDTSARASALAESERLRRDELHEAERLASLEAHREARDQIEATGRLAGSLAHDLRNSLQLVTAVELIEDAGLEPGTLEQVLSDVRTGLADAEHLAVRLETSEGAHEQKSGIHEHIRGALQHRIATLKGSIDFSMDLEECGDIGLSPMEIRRIVTNLVNNARDAMPGGGKIRVTLRRIVNDAHLTFRDTGAGMDEAVASRIFDPYFSTKGTKGTGLGLHGVREIMKSCGGQIRVESVPGVGTAFSLIFPLVSEETLTTRI